MPVVYGEPFLDSVGPLRILLVGTTFAALSKVIGVLLFSRGRVTYNVFAVAVGVAVTVLFDVLLIPLYGIVGASIATTISYLSIFVVLFVLLRKELDVPCWDLFILNRGDLEMLWQKASAIISK